MAKERLKTILLLSMLCISFLLTRHLWIAMPNDLLSSFRKNEVIGADYLLEDMIKPYKYLINFSNEAHTVGYADRKDYLWTNTRSIMTEALSAANVESTFISKEDFAMSNERRSIVFYFPENFNTYIISRSLGITKPNHIVEDLPEIDSVYFYLGKEEPFLIFSQGDQHLKVYNLNINTDKIKEEARVIEEKRDLTYYYPMRNTLGVDSDLFISYKMTKPIPDVYVENELDPNNISEMRGLAESFLKKNIDYIGEVVEDNGSIIYLYNQEVLKISPNGRLEYFRPLEEEVLERNLYISLNTAANFLAENMGIPKNMYLAKVEDIESEGNQGYRLSFRYRIRDLPLLLASDDLGDFVQIDVFNKNIRRYNRFIRKDMELIDDNEDNPHPLSAFDIINMNINYKLLESRYRGGDTLTSNSEEDNDIKEKVLSSITNIDIAYIDLYGNDRGEKLRKAWLIEFEDRVYAFDIYRGNLILEKDINR